MYETGVNPSMTVSFLSTFLRTNGWDTVVSNVIVDKFFLLQINKTRQFICVRAHSPVREDKKIK